mmetsp:Transcript_32422/g.75774  ORF Transcript_32422/g.75774 Transcript_32422/m.75774 type:complete len:108 (-) Transcript_32422:94-417(-)|eukprot:CAMPEP_0114135568 /NCGR_PEP_ID=MMETSP0043_2-20121206/14762_1 /TAXON_ID=464988 /ORGANISM="Hemiselmis andersenii, Strain CCMP644" /LENGTH=107 /DNA_ID=CAMNT_0001229287 /DNA_START=19 /DNA_END=342 /DNA_ORIENTATION=+
MNKALLFLSVALALLAASYAFSPASLPLRTSTRAVAAGPTMLLSPEQAAGVSGLRLVEEPLTAMDGRGDRRSKRGKRFTKSFGKCRARKGRFDEKTRTPTGGVLGQP